VATSIGLSWGNIGNMVRGAVYSGRVVYSRRDEDGVIDVVDENGVRSLQFGTSARQSTMIRRHPDRLALAYTQCMMTALLFGETPPSAALLLGVGGGSLAKFLLRQLPGAHVDAVEKRPAVVEVAQAYFDLPRDPRLALHLGDGYRFLEDADADSGAPAYDLALVDLHTSDGMAPVVHQAEFWALVRRRLTAAGVLSANLWFGYREDEEELVRRHLVAEFGDRVFYLPVAGKRNCIALAFAAPPERDRQVLEQRSASWRDRCGIDFSSLLGDLIRHNRHL